jgi:hypothetical protein
METEASTRSARRRGTHADAGFAALAAGAFLAGVWLRLYGLAGVPVSGDETHYYQDSRDICLRILDWRRHPQSRMHSGLTGYQGHPALGLFPARIAYRFLGADPVAMRLAHAMMGCAAIGFLYLIGRRMGGATDGATCAAIGSVVPLLVRYNRTLYLDNTLLLLAVVFLWTTMKAYGNARWWSAAGLATGLLMATKTSGVFLLPGGDCARWSASSPHMSGEHGFMIFVPGLLCLAVVGLRGMTRRIQLAVLGLVFSGLLPAAFLFGLRVMPTPYSSYLNGTDFGANFAVMPVKSWNP